MARRVYLWVMKDKNTALSRRLFLAGSTAALSTPLRAQTIGWADVAARAGAFEQCNALLIHQNGAEVVSQVFRGPTLLRAVPLKSVSKTFVAALIGAALDRGEIPAVTSTLADLAPQLIPRGADPRVGDLTIENLVTMQTGLERTSGANYGAWVSSANWVSDALSRPFVGEPGRGMLYSTGSFHVLGAILSEVSGQSLLSLARARIGGPLGFDVPAWTRDPQGRYLGGNEMAMTLAGMVRFGELYRMGGIWNGERVLGADWVRIGCAHRLRRTHARGFRGWNTDMAGFLVARMGSGMRWHGAMAGKSFASSPASR